MIRFQSRYTLLSMVCGRAVGYAISSPDAFYYSTMYGIDINGSYVDGVSVTYGSPRQHIWSFAAGHGSHCVCHTMSAPLPPSIVRDNYFCDGEYNGALWDGEDCTTACCTFNSPLYFNVTLSIEVRLCREESRGNEDIPIHLLQLFVL